MNNSSSEPLPARDEIDALLDEIDAGSMRMARLMTARYGDGSHPDALASPQYMLLKALRDAGPMRASDVAGSCAMKTSAVSMALQGLEERGYITRHHDAEDRRVVFVALTEEGLTRLARSEADRREMMRRYTSALTIDDLRSLVRIQNTLIDTVAAEHA